jgi:hypothetical protein
MQIKIPSNSRLSPYLIDTAVFYTTKKRPGEISPGLIENRFVYGQVKLNSAIAECAVTGLVISNCIELEVLSL